MTKLKIKSKNKYSFASEFAATRHFGGFSVTHAAKILGRHERTIEDWESGKQPCPAWALRLLTLESRYMDALYGLQADRGRTGFALGHGRSTMAANDAEFQTHQMQLRLV
ncbi:helix-turn-helix domain-containing protein [Herminiimonas contaminans]|uniref:Helix-turn-helix protein n=1 Tax=Herminiimonas contaminans TaxID=1111140 RepID=A0ABS0EW71_9BURK|nr:hypothetical protein [Herminiimonas contaminans]MBF8179091.1 hypothetical protein [Herminiimonas contaminans]